MMVAKPVLAVDIDEVLIPFRPNFLKFHNQMYGTNFTLDQFHTYMEGLEQEVYLHKMRRFVNQDNSDWQKPIEGALESIKRLKSKFEIYIVTARHNTSRDGTYKWLDKHFPGLLDGVHFVRNLEDDALQPKSKTCLALGAQVIIDDELAHARDCASEGIKVLLFGNYPWNQAKKLPANVIRVKDWYDVEKELINGA